MGRGSDAYADKMLLMISLEKTIIPLMSEEEQGLVKKERISLRSIRVRAKVLLV